MGIEARIGGPGDGGDKYNQEGLSLLGIVEEHDKNKKEFYAVLEAVSRRELDMASATPVINFRGSKVAATWRSIVNQLSLDHDPSSEEFVNSVATMLLHDEKERSENLNDYTPGGGEIAPLADGSVAAIKSFIRGRIEEVSGEVIEEIGEDPETIRNAIVSVLQQDYVGFMNEDSSMFVDALSNSRYSDAFEQRHSAKDDRAQELKRLLPDIGRHALDAVKIAAGVTLGVALSSWLKRR